MKSCVVRVFGPAVANEDAVTDFNVLEQSRIIDGQRVRSRTGLRVDDFDGLAYRQFARLRQIAKADARAAQVNEDRDRAVELFPYFFDQPHPRRAGVIVAVAHVEPEGVHTGQDHPLDPILGRAGRAQGRENLGAGEVFLEHAGSRLRAYRRPRSRSVSMSARIASADAFNLFMPASSISSSTMRSTPFFPSTQGTPM